MSQTTVQCSWRGEIYMAEREVIEWREDEEEEREEGAGRRRAVQARPSDPAASSVHESIHLTPSWPSSS